MDQLLELFLISLSLYAMVRSFSDPIERPRTAEKLIACLEEARRRGVLGELRMETHHGQLCVVGYGQRYRVRDEDHAEQLIARINWEVEKALGTAQLNGHAPDDEMPTAPESGLAASA